MDGRQLSNRGAQQQPASNAPSNIQRTGSLRDTGRDPSRRGLLPSSNSPASTTQKQRRPEEKDKSTEPPEPQYVVYLRLPFDREGFVDPPQVEWDQRKEMWLWKVLNKGAVAGGRRGGEIDWDALAQTLNVTRPFLLQQAAWLYKRQLSEIQAQMRRMGGSGTGVIMGFQQQPQSPVLNSPAAPGQHFSGGTTSRPGTAAEMRPATALGNTGAGRGLGVMGGGGGTRGLPPPSSQPMSRTASDQSHVTVTQHNRGQPLQPPSRPVSLLAQHARIPSLSNPAPRPTSPTPSDSAETSSLSSSSSSSEEGSHTLSSHAAIRRPGSLFNRRSHDNDSSDDDEPPSFLPFSVTQASQRDDHANTSSTGGTSAGSADMAGTITLRHRPARGGILPPSLSAVSLSDADASASDSGGDQMPRRFEYQSHSRSTSGDTVDGGEQGHAGHAPPVRATRRVGEMAGLLGSLSRGNSTGPNSPSMGSSFSDLSEESVSRSAMEEYLAAGGGGGASAVASKLGGLMGMGGHRRWGQ